MAEETKTEKPKKEEHSLFSLIKAIIMHKTVLLQILPFLGIMTAFYISFEKAMYETPKKVDAMEETIKTLKKKHIEFIKKYNKLVIDYEVHKGKSEFLFAMMDKKNEKLLDDQKLKDLVHEYSMKSKLKVDDKEKPDDKPDIEVKDYEFYEFWKWKIWK